MKRLTTDHPENNFETALNFVYGKDGAAYFRTGWDRDDVPVHEWARKQCAARGCDEFPGETLEEIDETICECGFDFPDCPVHLAYTFACQAVHLRDRLKRYEDTGLMPDEVERLIAPPPNAPLTLEELRKMNGEPVWVERHSHFDCTPHWALVHVHRSGDVYLTERNCGQILFIIGDKVYRRKPEEGTVSKKEVEQHEKV